MLARETAKHRGGQDRSIAERLVESRQDRWDQLTRPIHRQHPLMMLRAEMGGDGAGVSALIEGRLGETDRERVKAVVRPRRHECGEHQAGIEAARQKHPEGHIAHQPTLGRLSEQRGELVDQTRLGVDTQAVVRLDPKAPVGTHR